MGIVCETGGTIHAKQYLCLRPIANKYHEGKVKRTLKRVLKVHEITDGKVNRSAQLGLDCHLHVCGSVCRLRKHCNIVPSMSEWCFLPG